MIVHRAGQAGMRDAKIRATARVIPTQSNVRPTCFIIYESWNYRMQCWKAAVKFGDKQ
jgi:hypothetical protein